MARRARVSLESLVEEGVGLDYKDLMREVENEENLIEWIQKLSSLSRLELAGEGIEFACFNVGLLAFKGTDAARRSVLQ
jgi:predicted amino acid racemase